jgi:hypothetical protein
MKILDKVEVNPLLHEHFVKNGCLPLQVQIAKNLLQYLSNLAQMLTGPLLL